MDNNLCSDTLQICRTCLKEIVDTSFFYMDCVPSENTQLTIRQTLYSCIPELDLSIVANTVMCRKCVDTLLSVFKFKKNCLELETQINKYIQQVQHTGDLSLVEVARFHQPDIKNRNIQVKIEDLNTTENFKNKYLVCDTDFNEASECTQSFHQSDIKNLHFEIKIEDLDLTENFKNEDLVCRTSAFNEANECTEFTEPKYLLKLEKEENPNMHNSNTAQNCLREVNEHQDHNYSKILNKPNAYYECYTCGHKAESKLKLILHLEEHTRSLKPNMRPQLIEKVLSCSICEYKCNFKVNLKQHMRLHTQEKPFSCSVCEYQCNQKSNLNKHIRIHTGVKPFSCSVCKYQCSRKSTLKVHMRLHTGEKPFSCSVCKYQCSQKGSLKQHMQIHTGEKPFSCSVCKYQCSQKGRLKQHMQIHTGVKPFSCSVCEYQFSQKSNLKQHILIHTEEKPFSCSVCDYQSTQKGTLKRHMKIHA